ncbi:Growth hormone-inducible transmembrane protein [Armadillidium vulgare]|nr:Growth hormone-inducible transmembrane protein [Armadillidium vulgare]
MYGYVIKMLPARVVSGFLKTSVKTSILKASCNLKHTPTVVVIRSFREGGKLFSRRNQARFIDIQNVSQQGLKKKIGPLEVGQIIAAGGAGLGLGALCYYGLGLSNEPGTIDRMCIWPDYVRARVRDTYMYFGASVAATAASAVAIYRSPIGQRFFQFCYRHPIMSTVGLLAGLIASGQVMMAIPYSPGLGTKQMMWLANCGMIGLVVAPVGIFGGAIALRAAWYTAGIIGGLSTVAMCAPSDKFLNWGGPLGIGLGGIIHKAESHPHMYGVRPFDPINASHHIVMDTVNIFVRIVQILALGGGGRRK